jgi:aldehyde:ferredoxin oxidoreductase
MLPTRNSKTGHFEQANDLSGETMCETVLKGTVACWACSVRCKRVIEIEDRYTVEPAYGGPEFETPAALGPNR